MPEQDDQRIADAADHSRRHPAVLLDIGVAGLAQIDIDHT
jgi:hypothetical protein